MADRQQTRECYERALDIRLEKPGPEHADVASTYNTLGAVYYNMGNLQQAKEYYERALDIRLKSLGPSMLKLRIRTITWVLYSVRRVTCSRPRSILNVLMTLNSQTH